MSISLPKEFVSDKGSITLLLSESSKPVIDLRELGDVIKGEEEEKREEEGGEEGEEDERLSPTFRLSPFRNPRSSKVFMDFCRSSSQDSKAATVIFMGYSYINLERRRESSFRTNGDPSRSKSSTLTAKEFSRSVISSKREEVVFPGPDEE